VENHDDNPEVAAAKAIATIAHRSQADKIGVPYIEHPRRVAARLNHPKHAAAAWLHDVIEDCGITAENLAAAGISSEVIDAVVLLTRTEDNTGNGYYEAIRENPIALAVKLADIADNTDPERTARLEPEVRQRLTAKYENARKLLGQGIAWPMLLLAGVPVQRRTHSSTANPPSVPVGLAHGSTWGKSLVSGYGAFAGFGQLRNRTKCLRVPRRQPGSG
jgi:hypothetical protein